MYRLFTKPEQIKCIMEWYSVCKVNSMCIYVYFLVSSMLRFMQTINFVHFFSNNVKTIKYEWLNFLFVAFVHELKQYVSHIRNNYLDCCVSRYLAVILLSLKIKECVCYIHTTLNTSDLGY